MRELNTIICGVGGQGNLLIEQVLGKSAARQGYPVICQDTFGAAQRGGSVLSHVRIGYGVNSGLVPEGECHIVLGLEPKETLETAAKYLAANGLVITNIVPVLPARVRAGQATYPPVSAILSLLKELTRDVIEVDANLMAEQGARTVKAMNMVMAGVLAGTGVLPISPDTIREEVANASGRFAETNCRAFDTGFNFGTTKTAGRSLETR